MTSAAPPHSLQGQGSDAVLECHGIFADGVAVRFALGEAQVSDCVTSETPIFFDRTVAKLARGDAVGPNDPQHDAGAGCDRQPYRSDFWLELGGQIAEAVVRRTTPPPKCIVLDCDNTLWGGVIGEDGVSGIKADREYPGIAWWNVQRALLDAKRRGILLAICSKNNPDDAMEVLEKHPGMLLRAKNFAAMRISWNDKAQGLREIAAELNIGTDSIAFLDDNPVERQLVREQTRQIVGGAPGGKRDHEVDRMRGIARCGALGRRRAADEERSEER